MRRAAAEATRSLEPSVSSIHPLSVTARISLGRTISQMDSKQTTPPLAPAPNSENSQQSVWPSALSHGKGYAG